MTPRDAIALDAAERWAEAAAAYDIALPAHPANADLWIRALLFFRAAAKEPAAAARVAAAPARVAELSRALAQRFPAHAEAQLWARHVASEPTAGELVAAVAPGLPAAVGAAAVLRGAVIDHCARNRRVRDLFPLGFGGEAPTPFERRALEVLLANAPAADRLRATIPNLRVAARSYSGVGSFTDFVPVDDAIPWRRHLGGRAKLAGHEPGVALILFATDERPVMLEAVTYGDAWTGETGDPETFEIYADAAPTR